MRSRFALTVAGGVLVAVVLAAAATSDAPQIVTDLPQIHWDLRGDDELDVPPPSTVTAAPEAEVPEPTNDELPRPVVVLLKVALLALAGALIVLAAVAAGRAWQNRPRLIWRRQRAVEDFDVLEPVDLAAAVAADAAAQRAALAGGTPRNGIVECWLRLEAVIADAGVPRRQSDTSAELTERVLAARAVDPAAIRELSSLYHEARFSTHPMGDAQRQAAIAALDAVHLDLLRNTRDAPTAAHVGAAV